MNEIASNPEKQFKRKSQAIEFILAIPNIEEKISSKISFRELFKLKPLPEKFVAVSLQEISNAWNYNGNEANMCPCAKKLINKKYPKSRPPKNPYHIGCNCSLQPEYNWPLT